MASSTLSLSGSYADPADIAVHTGNLKDMKIKLNLPNGTLNLNITPK